MSMTHRIRARDKMQTITLVYSARGEEHDDAVVPGEVLFEGNEESTR